MNLREAKQELREHGYILEKKEQFSEAVKILRETGYSLEDKIVNAKNYNNDINAKLAKIKEVLTSFKYKVTEIEEIAEPHLKPKYRIYYHNRKNDFFIDCYLEDENSFTVRYDYGGFCFETDGETFEEAIENLIRNYKDE